jgi:hypothetical protein
MITKEDLIANLGQISWEDLMFALAQKMHTLGYPENALDYLHELEDHIEAGLSSLNSVDRAHLQYRMDNLKRSLR